MNDAAKPATTLRLLSPAQRRLLSALLLGGTFLLANSLYLSIATRVFGVGKDPDVLPVTYQTMLFVHIAGSLLLVVPALVFVGWHLPRALLRRTRGSVPSGVVVVLAIAFLVVSGLLILTAANSRQNAWAFVGHQLAGAVLGLGYLAHRRFSKDPAPNAAVLRAITSMLVLTLGCLGLHGLEAALRAPKPVPKGVPTIEVPIPEVWRNPPIADPFVPFVPRGDVSTQSPFYPSAFTTASGGHADPRVIHANDVPDAHTLAAEVAAKGFVADHDLGARSCERCHADAVAQWRASAHRFASFNNPFYKAAVDLTRETRGKEVSRWCAGCHDPALLVSGKMDEDVDLASAEAQAGLTCLACHAIDALHGTIGNGGYRLDDLTRSPYLFADAQGGAKAELHDYLLKAKPNAHRAALLKPFFRTSEFCGVCHKVSLDVPVNGYRWLRGQNDYDGWHNTGVAHNQPMTWYEPPATKQCQDCHMPLEDAPLGDVAAKSGKIRSHRFLSVNTALPHLRGDRDMIARTEAFLGEGKLRVDVFALHRDDGSVVRALDQGPVAVRPGEVIQLDVVVRNLGVGHPFPGGTNDSNEGWIAFEVKSGGRTLWHHGAIQEDGQVDPGAHFYQAILVDKNGARIAKRNPADIHAPVYANVIPPSGSDIARYRFRVPRDLVEPTLEIRAELVWRKFNDAYVDFVYQGKTPPVLPVTRISGATAKLAVRADAEARATVENPADWLRHNDYGVGLFLDGDTRGARAAFEIVARLAPDRADGFRNQARALLADGNLQKAEEFLRLASRIAPDDARTAFFWGQVLQESGRLDEALTAYRRTLQVYPKSRDTWSLLGKTLWQKGEAKASIEAFLAVLAIDPEDALAHHQRNLAYKALAAAEQDPTRRAAFEYAAGEAERAFEKYKIDENAAAVTLDYRQRHPHDNKMSQRIVVHEQEGP